MNWIPTKNTDILEDCVHTQMSTLLYWDSGEMQLEPEVWAASANQNTCSRKQKEGVFEGQQESSSVWCESKHTCNQIVIQQYKKHVLYNIIQIKKEIGFWVMYHNVADNERCVFIRS